MLAVGPWQQGCEKAGPTAGGTGGGKSGAHQAALQAMHSGYQPEASDWPAFLACWRSGVDSRLGGRAGSDGANALPAQANVVDRTGAARADTTAALDQLETRLQLKLPRSYRDFHVAVAGRGWYVEVDGFDREQGLLRHSLYPLAEVGRLRDVDPAAHAMWGRNVYEKGTPQEYARYGHGSGQAEWRFAGGQLADMVKVGGLDQGALVLLNPFEQTADGEMEAWVLAPWHGAARYRSFAELVHEMADRDVRGAGGFLLDPVRVRASACSRYLVTALSG